MRASTAPPASRTRKAEGWRGSKLDQPGSIRRGHATSLSTSALLSFRPQTTCGLRQRADPNKVWRDRDYFDSLPLPPLAKGMSRHRCPVGTKPRPIMQVAATAQQKHYGDPVSLGRDIMGRKDWWSACFEAVDGNSNGFITPAEFAALASRLEDEFGVLGDFKLDFNVADLNFDGRIARQEWKEYAEDMERKFGIHRCLMAAWRFLGKREAVPRRCVKTICITEGYDMESSLQLLTSCSKQASENLYDNVCRALEHQADPNAQLTSVGYDGYTPLIFLAMANSTVPGEQVARSIKTLISAKADVHLESQNSEGLGRLVPLRFAAQMQNKEGLAALLEYVDVGDVFQWAAGEHVEHVMLEQLDKLQVCGSSTLNKIRGKSKYSAQATILLIMFASTLTGGKLTSNGAQKLLNGSFEDGVMKKGSYADPNGKGIDGITALMEVAKRGDVKTVKVLLEGRANPQEQDTEGATALHFAAAALHSSVVKVLLEYRADPSMTDHAGFSAYMLVGEDTGSAATGEDMLLKDSLAREDIITMLRPVWDADEVIDAIEDLGEDLELFLSGEETTSSPLKRRATRQFTKPKLGTGSQRNNEDDLAAKLRLHETLFFDPLAIARQTCEGRAPRKLMLHRCGEIIMKLLQTDPLKGKQKKLTKYLLQASMGPEFDLKSKHVRVPWSEEDNRETYGAELKTLVKGLLEGFAAECDRFRSIIVKDAEQDTDGYCGKLRALPNDLVTVPESWQQDPESGEHWKVVEKRQLLRYDPEWARNVQNGATCCLALLRLSPVEPALSGPEHVSDLSDYSSRLQVHHRPMEELLAEGYVRYSELCNKGFQDLMCSIAKRVVDECGVNVTFPEELVPTKKLKRLSEKTRDAREEHGSTEWPGRSKEFLAFSHCFYILDTVRLSFVCNGETPQDEVACCLALFDAFKSCTVENEGLQMLRQKSGFAYGASAVGGYADLKLLVFADLGVYEAFDGTQIPLRIIGEVQLILHGYHKVKQRMHLAYEVNRGSFDRATVVAPSLDAT